VVAEMLSVEVKTKGEDGNVTRDTHHVNLERTERGHLLGKSSNSCLKKFVRASEKIS
jgi:hypothetical protein